MIHGITGYLAARAVSTTAVRYAIELGRSMNTLRFGSGMEREVCRRSDPRYDENLSCMRVFYTPRYYADIGEGHIFPIRKFELVRDRLLNEGSLRSEDFVEPAPASLEDVLLVHAEDYVSRLCNGTLTSAELRRL